MQEVRYVDPVDGTIWVRSGSCSHCGACCVGCEHLAWRGAESRCTGYGTSVEYKIAGCGTFPGDPYCARYFTRCGYHFTKVK